MKEGRLTHRLKLGGDPDIRAHPSMTDAKTKGRGERLGRWGRRAGPVGRPARAREEKGRRPCWLRAEKGEKERGEVGRLGLKRKGERILGFSFFKILLKLIFSNFQTSLKQETMHSNHDAQALVISNIIEMMFKTDFFNNLIMSLEKLNLIICCLN
jgi:hypothetical protein